MRIVILQDKAIRMKKFKQELIGHEVIHVQHAIDCINIIKSGVQIDMLFLDHDLNQQEQVSQADEDTGSAVVRALQASHATNVKEIIVHSHNTVAASNMHFDLNKAGYNVKRIPFNALKFE